MNEDNLDMETISSRIYSKLGYFDDETGYEYIDYLPSYQDIIYAFDRAAGPRTYLETIQLYEQPKISLFQTEAVISAIDSNKNKKEFNILLVINKDIPLVTKKYALEYDEIKKNNVLSQLKVYTNIINHIVENFIIPPIAKEIAKMYKVDVKKLKISYNKKYLNQKLSENLMYVIKNTKLRAIDEIS